MKINILPADMMPVKISKNNSSLHFTIPPALRNRHNLKADENIVIAFICKGDEDIKIIED